VLLHPGAASASVLQDAPPGIITMAATTDHAQKTVLMLATVRDRSVKLLELPAFSERGVLPEVGWTASVRTCMIRSSTIQQRYNIMLICTCSVAALWSTIDGLCCLLRVCGYRCLTVEP
jgi:hypothetical protein